MDKRFILKTSDKKYAVFAKDAKEARAKLSKIKDTICDGDKYQVWTINERGVYELAAEVDRIELAKSIKKALTQKGAFAQISKNGRTNIVNDSAMKDDRLSPMTYKKLKEMGYNKHEWQNLTQEQANKLVHSNETGSSNSSNKPQVQSTNNKLNSESEKTGSGQPKPTRTTNKQIIENNKQKTIKLLHPSYEVAQGLEEFADAKSTEDRRAIIKNIRNTAIRNAERNKTNVCEGNNGEEYKFDITDGSNYSKAFRMALGGVPVTVNGRIARVKFVTPDEYLAQSAKQKGISTSELLNNTDDDAYQNVLSELKKDKKLSSGIYMDYSNKSQEGNRRVRALKELGVTSIPVLYVGRKWDKEKDNIALHY